MHKQIFKYFSLSLCLVAILSSCDDYIDGFDTRKDEYAVRYNVTYSTVYDFHNIAHISYTNFFAGSGSSYGYTGKPRQIEYYIDGTENSVVASRVPKGAHVELSTYVDVPEALPNTKVEITIEVAKGKEYDYTEVAKASAECPLKGKPLTISYDVPNK